MSGHRSREPAVFVRVGAVAPTYGEAGEDTPRHWPSWYLRTARLCSRRVAEKWWLPSPLATK